MRYKRDRVAKTEAVGLQQVKGAVAKPRGERRQNGSPSGTLYRGHGGYSVPSNVASQNKKKKQKESEYAFCSPAITSASARFSSLLLH